MDNRNVKHFYTWLFLCAIGLIFFYWDITSWLAWCFVMGVLALIGAPVANFLDDAMTVQRNKADEIKKRKHD